MIPHRSGDEFVEAVRLIVVPLLQPFDPFNPVERSIVVMDNWEGHYHPSVRALIEGAGARLVFLPAYAPHLNPIEEAFAQAKDWIRRHRDHAARDPRHAFITALRSVGPVEAAGYCRHAGYHVEEIIPGLLYV